MLHTACTLYNFCKYKKKAATDGIQNPAPSVRTGALARSAIKPMENGIDKRRYEHDISDKYQGVIFTQNFINNAKFILHSGLLHAARLLLYLP